MRLLLLTSEFPPGPGGIGTHAHQLARQFLGLGWEVAIITSQNYAAAADIEAFNQAQPFPVVRLSNLRGAPLKAAYRWRIASRWIRGWQPDIMLASGDRDVLLGAQLARRYRLPWVAVEHGRIPPRWERPLKLWAFQQATSVVSVSRYSWQRLLLLGVSPRSGRVITNGADAARFKTMNPQEVMKFKAGAGLNQGRILLTVGNVTDRKGQDIVIRALPKIIEQVPDAHYFMAGLPTKEKQFARLARELGVASHVHFLGQVDDDKLLGLYNSCDVFVMMSRHTVDEFEGFGIAVVEAALCGKPAVVSGDSGLAEAIDDGVTGFAVPEGNERATAEAIISLLRDDTLRRRMGAAAQRRALAQQTWVQCAQQYDALFRNLLETEAHSAALGAQASLPADG
jgi:phosphatidylinositol alpha-1,6-mannosyltransferase